MSRERVPTPFCVVEPVFERPEPLSVLPEDEPEPLSDEEPLPLPLDEPELPDDEPLELEEEPEEAET